MPAVLTEEESQFVEAARGKGSLTEQMVEEALHEKATGQTTDRLPQILVRKGFLTSDQAQSILRSLQKPGQKERPSIGPYELLSKLGQGGMGVVYKARHKDLGTVVALKVLPTRLAQNKVFTDRFMREASAAQRLNHQNIVRGLDVGLSKGYHYLAMEFVDGESLSARLKRDGKIPEAEALRIARQVADALGCAAAGGLIHRDIKPENVMMTRDGTAKLTDFGLAKNVAEATIAQITQTGMVLGTPYYLSPEQARGEKRIDVRSDLYSLGATLYHLVTGEPPFTGPTVAVIVSKHITEAPEEPRRKNPDVTPGANDLISRLLAKDAAARPQSPADVVAAIDRIGRGEPPFTDAARTAEAIPASGPFPEAAEAIPTGAFAMAPSRGAPPARKRKPPRPAPAAAGEAALSPSAAAKIVPLLILGGAVAAGIVAAVLLLHKPPPPPEDGAGTGTGGPPPAVAEPATRGSPEALKALEDASYWAATNPTEAAEAIRRLQGVATRFPADPAAKAASDKVREIREAADGRAKEAYDRLLKDFDEAARRPDFPAARRAFEGFPKGIDLDGKYAKEIAASLERLDGIERAAWQKEEESARALAGAGNSAGALRIYQGAAARYTLPAILDAAKKGGEAVQARLTEAERSISAREAQARAEIVRIREGAGKRPWKDLQAELDAFQKKYGALPVVQQKKAELDALKSYLADRVRQEDAAEAAILSARTHHAQSRWTELRGDMATLEPLRQTFAVRRAADEVAAWGSVLEERERTAERWYSEMLAAYQASDRTRFATAYAAWSERYADTKSYQDRGQTVAQMKAYLDSTVASRPTRPEDGFPPRRYDPPPPPPRHTAPPRHDSGADPVRDINRTINDVHKAIRNILDW